MEKSLKEQNRHKIAGFVTANICFYILVIQSNSIISDDWFQSLKNLYSMAPAGVAVIIAGLLNSQISPIFKARIVFLRWVNPLPGARAFSKYAPDDPRVDISSLQDKYGELPIDAEAQNILWYKLYKANGDEHSVVDAHRDFLLYRDMASIGFILLAIFSVAAKFFLLSAQVYLVFALLLIMQLLVLINAARNHGIRFVTNVLAIESLR